MLNNKWDSFLGEEFSKAYFILLSKFLDDEFSNKIIFPRKDDIYNCFRCTDLNEVKVVMLGQDPYHGDNQAHGLSFSSLLSKRPASLRNIFKELYNDLGIARTDNNLTDWANQGVLLLNAIMTVEKAKPSSHKGKGWEIFTDNVIRYLSEYDRPIIFVLWGNYAKSKKGLIDSSKNYIIEEVHPSPLSAYSGFFGSKPFSRINSILGGNKLEKIEW